MHEPKPSRWPLVLAAAPILLAVVVAVVVFRGRTPGTTSITQANGAVVGVEFRPGETSDNGEGSVTVSARLTPEESTTETIVLSLALNTHSVDLSSFNPVAMVALRTAQGKELAGTLARDPGEQSSHHQSFALAFPNPGPGQATVVVRDVAGIAERDLPLTIGNP